MKPFYNTIYLSPHLDDVALSCGGQIFSQTAVGQSVLIVTIMAGDPSGEPLSEFASLLHDRWQLAAEVVADRRQEDRAACSVLGADYLHWEIPDCIYRSHPETGQPLYGSRADIFGKIQALETPLIDQLVQQIAGLPETNRMTVPLTVGGHVDHQIVRLAAERVRGAKLIYYEDYPYVQNTATLTELIAVDDEAWQSEVVPVREIDLEARVAAAAAYKSQISTFFNGRADMAQQIKHYVELIGGERLWTRRLDGQSDN